MLSVMILSASLAADPQCPGGICPPAMSPVQKANFLQRRLWDAELARPYARTELELEDIRADIRQLRQQLFELALLSSPQCPMPYVRDYPAPRPVPTPRVDIDLRTPGYRSPYADPYCPVCPQPSGVRPPARPGVPGVREQRSGGTFNTAPIRY